MKASVHKAFSIVPHSLSSQISGKAQLSSSPRTQDTCPNLPQKSRMWGAYGGG